LANRKVSIEMSENLVGEFEVFMKALPTSQEPVAGNRLYKLAKAAHGQREKHKEKQSEDRALLAKAKAQGLTA